MKRKILIVGAGGHAHSCIDVIEQCNQFKIYGLIKNTQTGNLKVFNYSIVGTDKDLPKTQLSPSINT